MQTWPKHTTVVGNLSKGRVDIKEELALYVPAGVLPKVSLVPPTHVHRLGESHTHCITEGEGRKRLGCSPGEGLALIGLRRDSRDVAWLGDGVKPGDHRSSGDDSEPDPVPPLAQVQRRPEHATLETPRAHGRLLGGERGPTRHGLLRHVHSPPQLHRLSEKGQRSTAFTWGGGKVGGACKNLRRENGCY